MKTIEAKTKKEVVKKIGYTPEKIIKVDSGGGKNTWAVFDTISDYETWKNQR